MTDTRPDDHADDGVAADIARIRSMRDAGTITHEEADRLIAVLVDVSAAEADIEAISSASEAAPEASTPPEEPSPPVPGSTTEAPRDANRVRDHDTGTPRGGDPWADAGRVVDSALGGAGRIADDIGSAVAGAMRDVGRSFGDSPRGADAEAEGADAAQEGTRWLHVSMLAGDLRLEGSDVAEPEFEGDGGDAELSRDGDGWRLRHRPEPWGRWGGSAPDLRLRVPREIGVRLSIKAGDVRIRDVRAVTGSLMAGDLRLDDVRGVDLRKAAGDVDARLRLTRGVHRIVARAGDVDVTLLEGSDVEAKATVTMGDARGGARFQGRRRGMGAEVGGRIGAGTARLRVHLSAGDVQLEAEGSDG